MNAHANFPPTYPAPVVEDAIVQDILRAATPHSMVNYSGIEFLIHETVRLIRADVRGAIVECGVWRGGAALGALLVQRAVFGRVVRPVYLLDSFEGLPRVTERDGPLAHDYQASPEAERYLDNCRADESEVRSLLSRHGFGDGEAIILKGWFKDRLPEVRARCADEGIALLRLDGDWYDSTLDCLESLEPLVANEGTVIVDDYYAWDGCARAVHDYLSRHDLPYRLKSCYNHYAMYFVKRPFRNRYDVF